MHVLIVEDDEDFRRSLVDLLEKEGYSVEVVGDGVSALQRLPGADVLLTDIGIPGLDGLELLNRARAHSASLAVLVMSGYDSPRRRSEAARRGAYAYLAKPFESVELLSRLQDLDSCLQTWRHGPKGTLEDGSQRREKLAAAAARSASIGRAR